MALEPRRTRLHVVVAMAAALMVSTSAAAQTRIDPDENRFTPAQDVELGRPRELEPLVGAVVELGELVKVPTPNISAVYASVSLLAQTLNAQRGKLRISQ